MAYGSIPLDKRLKDNIKNYKLDTLYDYDEIQELIKAIYKLTKVDILVTDRHGEKSLAVGEWSGAKINVEEKPGTRIRICNRTMAHVYFKYDNVDEPARQLVKKLVESTVHTYECMGEKAYIVRELEIYTDELEAKLQKETYQAKAIIIATGASPVKIGCPGEAELTGKGVSYCATCDAGFFEDFEVYVMGGGDAAVEEAMYLTKFARKVTIIHRRDELRAAKSIQEKAFANPKIDFMWNTVITELTGDGILDHMVVKDTKTGETKDIYADEDDGMFGVFVFIGYKPVSQVFEGSGLEMNEKGYIPTDDQMRTNIPGVYAVGDIRVKELRQVVTAAADGAIAAWQAAKYVENREI